MKLLVTLLIATSLLLTPIYAAEKAKAKILLQETTSWNGDSISYPKGDAQISVVKIMVPRGVVIPMHCHPMPLAAYMISGAIEVTTSSGEKKTFRQGDAFLEVMNRWHSGRGIGENSELIAVYAGSQALPLSVSRDAETATAINCR